MLESISLKFTERSKPIVIPAEGVTIFVGPNNSGKSLVLRELEDALTANGTLPSKILDDFELIWPTPSSVSADIQALRKKPSAGMVAENVYVGRFLPQGALDASQLHRESLFNEFKNKNKKWVASQFLKYFLIRLDGRTRFALSDDRPTGDLIGQPQNVLAHLFQDDKLRADLRRIIYDAVGLYFVIDPTMGGTLRVRLSATAPTPR